MEEIYANAEYDKYDDSVSTNKTGPRTPEKRRFHRAVVLCLGLLSVFLLAGLISLSVHSAELSSVKANLTELLQASFTKISSLTTEKDQLNTSLIRMTEERNELQKLSRQKKTCPSGWTMFSCICYFLSTESGSWTKGREDCRNRGADLVVINSETEQKFLSEFTKVDTWIGLNDRQREGTWTWIDGTPLNYKYWDLGEPNNVGPSTDGEDCGEIKVQTGHKWNDEPCEASQQWICEKKVQH